MKRKHLWLTAMVLAVMLGGCYGTSVGYRSGYYGGSTVAVAYSSPPLATDVYVDPYGNPGHVWINGRYDWTGGQWVWREGYWDVARPGHVYIQGYWDNRGGQYVWVDGYWAPQRPGYAYIDGYWDWGGGGYYWRPGRWSRARPGYAWHGGRWTVGPRGHRVWKQGGWRNHSTIGGGRQAWQDYRERGGDTRVRGSDGKRPGKVLRPPQGRGGVRVYDHRRRR